MARRALAVLLAVLISTAAVPSRAQVINRGSVAGASGITGAIPRIGAGGFSSLSPVPSMSPSLLSVIPSHNAPSIAAPHAVLPVNRPSAAAVAAAHVSPHTPVPAAHTRLALAGETLSAAAAKGATPDVILESLFTGAAPSALTPVLSAASFPEVSDSPAERRSTLEFGVMFDLARRVLVRPAARKFLREIFKEELTLTEEQQAEYGLPERIKELSESQFMLLLQHNPKAWPLVEKYLKVMERADKKEEPDPELHEEWEARFRELLSDENILKVFRKLNDPLTPMRLDAADGEAGYSDARVFANHQTIEGGRKKAPEDLKKILIDFIAGAETELMFNVFDFDLMDVADAMIERAKAGVKITGGIDKSVIESRPDVKAVFDKLNAQKGITMRAVDSVGLNHQKIVARDFSDPKKAKIIFSSGNFTQSCLGPEGDLKDVPAEKRPKDSVPNANHFLVLDSYLLAQVAVNSLTKTLVFGLRGDEYPLGGAYRVLGVKGAGDDETPLIIAAFSPKGGLGDINRDMTRRLILQTRGPLRLLQFAFSADSVREAIIERARLEKAEGGALDLKTVGDAPFAMRPWSVFLALSGYLFSDEEKEKGYIEAAENALREAVGAELYEAVRRDIRVAGMAYRMHQYKGDDGVSVDYAAKLHHKALISGLFAILGTSFNFSEAANSNQEQLLVAHDAALVAAMTAVFDGMFAMSPKSIVDEVMRRNGFLKDGGDDELKADDRYKHVDAEAGRSPRNKP